MKQTRRKFDSAFKAKVALEAIRERETLSGLAVKYDLHPNQISQWKQEFLEKSAAVFDHKLPSSASTPEVDVDKLYAKIGELQMERDFLKKLNQIGCAVDQRLLVDKEEELSIRKQCDLLEINRSTIYYEPKGESKENLEIMQIMDKHILDEPTAGVLTMQSMLGDQGIAASYERVRRLMRLANIRPIYPRRHLTQWKNNEYVHPYLLKDLNVERINQVWEIDITYVPMAKGFMYLTAIIDVYSRYIVGWGLSE